MTTRINPFKPNHPVFSGVFSGRYNELNRLDETFFQTRQENPTNLLFLGERGIGKSSLLLYANYLAKGEIAWSDSKNKHNFLTIQINISSDMTPLNFATKIKNAITREFNKENKALECLKSVWGFINKFEIAGVSYKSETGPVDSMHIYDDLIFSIIDTIKSITSPSAAKDMGISRQKDGLVLLLDETDNASKALALGAFVKNLTESLAIENQNKLCIVMAGLPKVHDVLSDSHSSSLRLFEEFMLAPLNKEDAINVIKNGVAESNRKNPELSPIVVTKEALEQIWRYSEGYPHFIQQIGYSVFRADTDSLIDECDVDTGMLSEGGALELIGNRYYKDLYYERISVNSYRQILKIMSKKRNDWISKEEIKQQYSGKKTSLDNGLKALRDRNIILTKKGTPGLYRLQWASFALWITQFTENDGKDDDSEEIE